VNTRILPDGKQLGLDPKLLRSLLRDALESAARALSGREIRTQRRRGGLVGPDGTVHDADLEIPNYLEFRRVLADRLESSPAGSALTGYLWSRNALKLELSTDDDSEPPKDAWASFTWRHLVLSPLSHLALRSAMEDLTLGRNHVTWSVTSRALDGAADELVGLLTGGDLIVTAFCPLVAVHLGDIGSEPSTGMEVELAPGIGLVEWSWTPEQQVFLNQYGHHYRDGDGVRLSRLLRIQIRVPCDADPVAEVASTIDRVKWALLVAMNRDIPVHELATIVRSASGHARDVLQRGSPNFGSSEDRSNRSIGWLESKGWQVIHLGPALLARVRELLADLDATSASDDVASALWSFGRSSVAPTPRDALLDAVIGLERLVVPHERGETTYRFRLHGQALLAGEGEVLSDLGKLYAQRSTVAHGDLNSRSPKQRRKTSTLSSRARYLLAKAIHAANQLVIRGTLRVDKGHDVAAAIADLVRTRASKE
jgi:hypothetical protein